MKLLFEGFLSNIWADSLLIKKGKKGYCQIRTCLNSSSQSSKIRRSRELNKNIMGFFWYWLDDTNILKIVG